MLYEKLSSAGCSFQHSFFSQEVQNVIFKSKHRQDARNEPFFFFSRPLEGRKQSQFLLKVAYAFNSPSTYLLGQKFKGPF